MVAVHEPTLLAIGRPTKVSIRRSHRTVRNELPLYPPGYCWLRPTIEQMQAQNVKIKKIRGRLIVASKSLINQVVTLTARHYQIKCTGILSPLVLSFAGQLGVGQVPLVDRQSTGNNIIMSTNSAARSSPTGKALVVTDVFSDFHAPRHVALAPDGSFALVANYLGNCVTRVNLHTGPYSLPPCLYAPKHCSSHPQNLCELRHSL